MIHKAGLLFEDPAIHFFVSPVKQDCHEGVIILENIKIEQHSSLGLLWFVAWLFTIGFLRLTFWKGVIAIVLWPYYLGATFSSVLR